MNEYVIHAKLKNNLILKRILENAETVARFCDQHNLYHGNVGELINLKKAALNKKTGKWTKLALRLAEALEVSPDDLFTEEQRVASLRSNEAFIEMNRRQVLEMVDPQAVLETKEIVQKMLERANFSERTNEVLRLRFAEDMTLEEVGKHFGVTGETVRHIEAKALRKLRHPSVRDGLMEWPKAGDEA